MQISQPVMIFKIPKATVNLSTKMIRLLPRRLRRSLTARSPRLLCFGVTSPTTQHSNYLGSSGTPVFPAPLCHPAAFISPAISASFYCWLVVLFKVGAPPPPFNLRLIRTLVSRQRWPLACRANWQDPRFLMNKWNFNSIPFIYLNR